jgi:hypothetical protein
VFEKRWGVSRNVDYCIRSAIAVFTSELAWSVPWTEIEEIVGASQFRWNVGRYAHQSEDLEVEGLTRGPDGLEIVTTVVTQSKLQSLGLTTSACFFL